MQMEMEAEAETQPPHSETLTTDADGVKHMAIKATPKELPDEPVAEGANKLARSHAVTADDVPSYEVKREGLVDNIVGGLHDLVSDDESASGALASGFVKGGTLGFGDELYGALNAIADQPGKVLENLKAVRKAKEDGTYDPDAGKPDVPGKTSYTLKQVGEVPVTKESVSLSPSDTIEAQTMGDAYRGYRDQMREHFNRSEKAQPEAFLAGELGGSFALPLPGPGKAKGLVKALKTAGVGAGIGGVAGLGNSEEDLTLGDNKMSAMGDTAKGAGFGGLAGGILGYGASKLDPWLQKAAEKRAYKALEPYMETIKQELIEKNPGRTPRMSEVLAEAQRLGRRVLDEEIIPKGKLARFADAEKLADIAADKLEDAGRMKGGFVDHAAGEIEKVNPLSYATSEGKLATKIEQAASEAALDGETQGLARALNREAKNVRQGIINRAEAGFDDPAARTLQEAEKAKTKWQKSAFRSRASGDTAEAKQIVARLAKEQAEDAISSHLGPDELETFKALKNRYGDLAKISNTANHGALRTGLRNNTVGLGDKIAAETGASMAHGMPPEVAAAMATATAGAHHIANHRGSAALARTLDNMSKTMPAMLTPAAEVASDDPAERWAQYMAEHPDPVQEETEPPHKFDVSGPWDRLKKASGVE